MEAVGCDFFDFIRIDDHRFGALVADVTGHGIPVALIATMVKTAAAPQFHVIAHPSRVLAAMNEALYGQTDDHCFFPGAFQARPNPVRKPMDIAGLVTPYPQCRFPLS